MRVLLATALVAIFVALAAAASAPVVTPVAASPSPRYTPIPVSEPTAPPDERPKRPGQREARLAGRFVVPLAGAEVPDDPDLLPGAPRDYRAGIHEGVDFPAPEGTPVLAAADGTIVRVDTSFRDWTPEEEQRAFSETQTLGYTPLDTLDRIRGRQVWIDHGGRVVTRYAHLAAVAPINIGDHVTAGTVIGEVGSSGYPEGGPHLHFEVRVGDDYAGDDLSGDPLRRAIARLFR